MSTTSSTPTLELYPLLQLAYNRFNTLLFDGQLPACMITVQREKGIMGYFYAKRWAKPHEKGAYTHELALNPAYFATRPLIDLFQTLVHELCHLWQHEFGKMKSLKAYHNKEWADKMESIGLMPSDTGQEGGKRTGQKMSDYPIAGGRFELACEQVLQEGFSLPWVDRKIPWDAICHPLIPSGPPSVANIDVDQNLTSSSSIYAQLRRPLAASVANLIISQEEVGVGAAPPATNKTKSTYQCTTCKTKVWGKAGLRLVCGECGGGYREALD